MSLAVSCNSLCDQSASLHTRAQDLLTPYSPDVIVRCTFNKKTLRSVMRSRGGRGAEHREERRARRAPAPQSATQTEWAPTMERPPKHSRARGARTAATPSNSESLPSPTAPTPGNPSASSRGRRAPRSTTACRATAPWASSFRDRRTMASSRYMAARERPSRT